MIACDLHENRKATARSKYPEVVNILLTLMFQDHGQHLWTLTMMALSCYMQQFLLSTAQIYCWRWCSRNSVCGDADEMSELKLNVRVKATHCTIFYPVQMAPTPFQLKTHIYWIDKKIATHLSGRPAAATKLWMAEVGSQLRCERQTKKLCQ